MYWLQSRMRQSFLTYRFYTLPLLFGNKPIADVYLSLNDPHSFILAQVLSNIQQRFNVTFRLYLVSNTALSSEVDATLLKQWALKDANRIADKYDLIRVSRFPDMNTLVTGQQTWLLHVKTVAQALEVFTNTWTANFTEHFPISTPLITAQINNQRRMFLKGSDTSGCILFCGTWFFGVDRLENLAFLLNEKGLGKKETELNYNRTNSQFLDENKPSRIKAAEVFLS